MHPETANLEIAIAWLKNLVDGCLKMRFGQAESLEIAALNLYEGPSKLADFIDRHQPSLEEFAIFLLALVPHLQPDFFSKLIVAYLPEGGDLPEFGGVKGTNHRGILPTGETAQYLLAGDDMEKRLEIQYLLSSEHWFARHRMLWLEPVREGEPAMSGRLIVDPETVELMTLGIISKPRFGIDFPAELLHTDMSWDDLVLPANTLRHIQDIEHWIKHNDTLLFDWDLKKKLKPGYRALFYGPPGTGKTITATLLGKVTGKAAFRIDLSHVVSKYIGDTEKNLSRLFDKAENKDWILFFDEADALFGKRTDIRDAHDKYANQEVAYLLQRIENYNGLIILATNQRGNIDDAFARRFQAIIPFPMPRPEDRYQIWLKTIPGQIETAQDVDWREIASRYELSGAAILNVVHFCSIELLASGSSTLELTQLESAIHREFIKEGRIV